MSHHQTDLMRMDVLVCMIERERGGEGEREG